MRVLITCHALAAIGGVQTHCRDLALWLRDRGHHTVVYGPWHGATADQLKALGIPVTDDLASIHERPDIIHGNSPLQTMAALLWFTDAPALFMCHEPRGETPAPTFGRIYRYVAVDDACRARAISDGFAADRIAVILNGVDLSRFRQRAGLPPRPKRAVAFGNYASELTHLPAIRTACRERGIDLDVLGDSAGTARSDPESSLPSYDLAFAKAKCAIEAMACGVAVVLCDADGVGGMVRTTDVERLRRLNFGLRTLTQPVSPAVLSREIERYDAGEAGRVSAMIRATASTDSAHDAFFALYEEIVAEHDSRPLAAVTEDRAAARFLQDVANREQALMQRRNGIKQMVFRIFRIPLVGSAMARVARLVR